MANQEAHIASIGTAVPYPISTERYLEVDRKMRESNGQPESTIARIRELSEGTGILNRHYSHPHWLPVDESPQDYPHTTGIALTNDIFTSKNYLPDYWERMTVFHDTCVNLAVRAAEHAVRDWGGKKADISHVITTCTSGWSEPGIALSVIERLDSSFDTQKAELNFNGCFCGATCLRLARDIIRAGDAAAVLVVAVEVASTHYDVTAIDISSLVAHSLFADGAAAVVVARDGVWRYTQTGMSLVPQSRHLLGLAPLTHSDHSSYRMTLNKRVGKQLGDYFRNGLGTNIFNKLYDSRNESKPALGIHPGGPNILDNLKLVFEEHGWPACALDVSYNTLAQYSNLGAAAMLFVLANSSKSTTDNKLVTMAFGPGVTVEWATLDRV